MEDLDDLFTDQLNDQLNEHLGEQLNDQLNAHLETAAAAAPPPGLAERLDELRLSGCTQKIAWSRMGAIAHITSDRRDVKISCLQFKGGEGVWGMSEYTDKNLSDFMSRFYRGFDLTHITWSPHGTDLLIIDSCGRIAVGIVFIALNRLIIPKALNNDPEDNLNAVVGLKWLDTKRRISFSRGAEKVDGVWKFSLHPFETKGPYSIKSAFLIVTRGAFVKLFYQGASEWQEAKAEIDGISSCEDMLTHADFCSDKDDALLLAVHTVSKQLKLCILKVDWQIPKTGEAAPGPATLSLHHLSTLDICAPSFTGPDFVDTAPDHRPRELELSHLKLLPRPPDDESSAVPAVLGIFSCFPGIATDGSTFYNVISRWELREEKGVIDPSFTKLSTKKTTSNELKGEHLLTQLDDLRVSRVAIFIKELNSGSCYAIGYSDGDIEFRERNMSMQTAESMPDRASTLTKVGFSFDKLESSLYMALSPHATVKATFARNHDCKISHLHLPVELAAPDTLDKVTASLVLQHTVSETSFNMGNNPTDDLLMTMWHFGQQYPMAQRKQMDVQFMRDIYRTLNFVDKCTETNMERLVRFTPLSRALSMQGALGYQSDRSIRWSLTSKVAFTLQSLRLIALSLSFALSPKTPAGGSQELEINRPETLQYITTQVGWMINLVDYVLDQLFEINRLFSDPSQLDLSAIPEKASDSFYPCLILLLCSVTRSYIRFNCRGLGNLPPFFSSPAAAPPSPLAPYYAVLSATIRNGIIPHSQLESILDSTEQILQQTYSTLTRAQRQDIEMQLLAAGEIPAVLLPAIQKIFSGPVEQARQHAGDSEAELAFKDWSTVSLGKDSELDDPRKKNVVFDGVRKIELKKGKVRTRICLRCNGHMEDLMPGRHQKGWIWNMMRTCYCGGHWVVEQPVQAA